MLISEKLEKRHYISIYHCIPLFINERRKWDTNCPARYVGGKMRLRQTMTTTVIIDTRKDNKSTRNQDGSFIMMLSLSWIMDHRHQLELAAGEEMRTFHSLVPVIIISLLPLFTRKSLWQAVRQFLSPEIISNIGEKYDNSCHLISRQDMIFAQWCDGWYLLFCNVSASNETWDEVKQ